MSSQLYAKILIATDGSDRNKTAIEEGLRIARACGSMIFAVHVMDTRRFDASPTDAIMADPRPVMQKQAEDALAIVSTAAQGVTVETAVLEGKPDVEIVRYAEEKGIDLIVIGTHAKRGFERLLLGSVAEQVLRSTPCRVLVVK